LTQGITPLHCVQMTPFEEVIRYFRSYLRPSEFPKVSESLAKSGLRCVNSLEFGELMKIVATSEVNPKPVDQISLAKIIINHMAIPRGDETIEQAAAIAKRNSIIGRLQLLVRSKSEEMDQFVRDVPNDIASTVFDDLEITAMRTIMSASNLNPNIKINLDELLGRLQTEDEEVKDGIVQFPDLLNLLLLKDTAHVVNFLEQQIEKHKSRCLTSEQFSRFMVRLPQCAISGRDAVRLTKALIKNMNKFSLLN
jgi:hypothetical protein